MSASTFRCSTGSREARPDWQFVMIGPVVKIDPADLPRRPNIHYLGSKSYTELPHYIAGWDVALLLFARNEATRFISPTKTPEYLAAGKPVVSTSIRDVVNPYGELGPRQDRRCGAGVRTCLRAVARRKDAERAKPGPTRSCAALRGIARGAKPRCLLEAGLHTNH